MSFSEEDTGLSPWYRVCVWGGGGGGEGRILYLFCLYHVLHGSIVYVYTCTYIDGHSTIEVFL